MVSVHPGTLRCLSGRPHLLENSSRLSNHGAQWHRCSIHEGKSKQKSPTDLTGAASDHASTCICHCRLAVGVVPQSRACGG